MQVKKENMHKSYQFSNLIPFIQVAVCKMERKDLRFVSTTTCIQVNASRRDGYEVFADKAARALKLSGSGKPTLFTCVMGSQILDQPISLRTGAVEWTVGAYLQRCHKSPDKISFGVAKLEVAGEVCEI